MTAPPKIIDQRFEVLEVLGRGGYGMVYAGRQLTTGQRVAIKVLHAEIATQPKAAAAFEREARIVAELKHPNIVPLIDSGRLDGGALYVVLDFIEGEPLSGLLERKGALPFGETTHLMVQVLDAIECAHAKGVIHRDLKPANIMITTTGIRRNAQVLDFGVAVLEEAGRSRETGFQGTPLYVAPEQIEGAATVQSDLYAWGLTFLECLKGSPIITASSLVGALGQHLNPRPFDLPAVLDGHPLRPVLQKAVEKDPQKRFKSARAVMEALLESAPSASGPIRVSSIGLSAITPHRDDRTIAESEELAATVGLDRSMDLHTPGHPAELAPSLVGPTDEAAATHLDLTATLPASLEGKAARVSAAELLETARERSQGPTPRSRRALWGLGLGLLALLTALTIGLSVGLQDSTSTLSSPQESESEELAPTPQSPRAPVCQGDALYSNALAQCVEQSTCDEQSLWAGGRCRLVPEDRRTLARACLAGDLLACVELGNAFLSAGSEGDENSALGAELLRRACDGGSAKGCYDLGAAYGGRLPADAEARRRLYGLGCDGGNSAGCNDLGLIYTRGDDVEPDFDRARQLFVKACDMNFAMACYNLAGLYASGRGVEQNMERARSLYKDACLWSYGPACRWWGTYLTQGDFIAVDLVEALRYWQRGCDSNDAVSCHKFAMAYYEGLGVEKDAVHALEIFEKACTLDHASSCWNTGFMLELGKGVAVDKARARKAIDKGCALRDAKSCTFHGIFLREEGRFEEAVAPLQMACDNDRGDACYELGRLYQKGRGVEVSLVKASSAFVASCDLGELDGCYGEADLRVELAQDDVGRERAAATLATLCDAKSHARSCARSAQLLQKSAARDDQVLAMERLRRSCDLGLAVGCELWGIALHKGERVAKDMVGAAKAYAAACDAKGQDGCARLGLLLRSGEGIDKDETRATELLQVACAAEVDFACQALGASRP